MLIMLLICGLAAPAPQAARKLSAKKSSLVRRGRNERRRGFYNAGNAGNIIKNGEKNYGKSIFDFRDFGHSARRCGGDSFAAAAADDAQRQRRRSVDRRDRGRGDFGSGIRSGDSRFDFDNREKK